MSQNVRRYIYSLGTPIGAILVFYGLLSEDEVALWLSLLGTALLMGEGALAVAHTPKLPKSSSELIPAPAHASSSTSDGEAYQITKRRGIMRIVALEEHFVTKKLLDVNGDFGLPEPLLDKLLDVGEQRIADMDAAGIDVQVLSALAPATQTLNEGVAVPFARKLNDELKSDVINAHPDRFEGFATLPLRAPEAAADELRRTVEELGFVGALINGMVDDRFLSDERFAPVLQAAQDLGVPIYLHPGNAPKRVASVYYEGMDSYAHRTLGMNGYGWHYETALHVLRLVLDGTMDRFPDLQWIIGHAGEGLPFQIDRIEAVHGPSLADLELDTVTEYLRRNVYATTSGYPYNDPFDLTRKLFGDDRVMFSVDYPFADNVECAQWMHDLRLTPDLRERFAHRTADALLGLGADASELDCFDAAGERSATMLRGNGGGAFTFSR